MAYHIDAAGLAKQLGMSVEEAGRKNGTVYSMRHVKGVMQGLRLHTI